MRKSKIEDRKSKISPPPTHFLDVEDHAPDWLRRVLDTAHRLREQRRRGEGSDALARRSLAMLFEKPSLRTRASFEQAMNELGGRAIHLTQQEVGMGKRESAADIARVLSGMMDAITARVHEHATLRELAHYSDVPVINALSDHSHPCQALADLMTLRDEFGEDLTGRKLAFIGDGNNVARSLAWLCGKLGVRFALAAPPGYQLEPSLPDQIRRQCPGAEVVMTGDPREAVAGADAIYTDTFVSMGQEEEKAKRLKAFEGFQVNDELLRAAPEHTIVLHCLPAYRGVEITDSVIDGPRSRVFPQAHNRLHAQKGLLAVLMDGKTGAL